jgi:hypothetical protein
MVELRLASIPNLITFLKRLKSVDRSVLLELTPHEIFCKVHTPDKSVMKYSYMEFEEVFEGTIDPEVILKGKPGKIMIKIGLIEVGKFIDCFKHFRPEEEVMMQIKTDVLDGSCVATEINLNSKSLNIKVKCADLSLLSYVEDDILSMVHSKEDPIAKFKIYQSDFSSIVSLCGLESNSEELLAFDITKKEVRVKGESFNYRVNVGADEISAAQSPAPSSIYKNQLSYMEAETCECYIHENRIVLFSEQSTTSIAFGVVIK